MEAIAAFIEEQKKGKPQQPPRVSYKDAGVDIDAGNALVERIKPACKSTKRPGCDSDLGGFGGLFDLSAAGYSDGKDTILVGATDGVGAKLKVTDVEICLLFFPARFMCNVLLSCTYWMDV